MRGSTVTLTKILHSSFVRSLSVYLTAFPLSPLKSCYYALVGCNDFNTLSLEPCRALDIYAYPFQQVQLLPERESIRVSLGPSVIDTTLSSPQPQNQRSDPALLEEHRNRLFNEYVFQSIIK